MWRFVQNFNLFCGSFLLLFSWKSGSFVEVLWLWNLNKNCGSDIWTNTLWLNTILFVVCWSLLFFSFATIIGYVQKLIVLLTKTHFRTWLWETSSCGVWLTNIWSLDSLHSCLALGIHKHGCFSICIFRLVFVKNTFFFRSWQLELHTGSPSQAWWTDCWPISILRLHSGKNDLEFD